MRVHLNDLLLTNLRSIVCNLKVVLKWFGNNKVMANPGKFQYMLLTKHKPLKIEVQKFKVKSPKSVNFLPITIDHNLTNE